MKARITYYFAAFVALVLILSSLPTHATERRDPLIIQDMPQTQAARSSSMVHAATKPAPASPRKKKPSNTREKNGQEPNKAPSSTSHEAAPEQSGSGATASK